MKYLATEYLSIKVEAGVMGKEFIEELKCRIDPDKTASSLGIRRRGKRYFCPNCQTESSKTPDLVVDSRGYHCFKCGIGGDLLDFIMTFGQMNFQQTVEWLEADTGLYSPTEPGNIQQAPKSESVISESLKSRILKAFLDSCRLVQGEALSWFVDEKGVSPEVIKSCHLRLCGKGYKNIMDCIVDRFGQVDVHNAGLLKPSNREPSLLVPVFWHYYASNIDFLVIPYIKNKLPVYLKARPAFGKEEAIKKNVARFLNMPGRIPCLYNIDALKFRSDKILICEGESDTWSALSRGYAAVGSPGAKLFKARWVYDFKTCFRISESNILDERASIYEYESGFSLEEANPAIIRETGKISTVFLVLDSDLAGKEGAAIIEEFFKQKGMLAPHRVILPGGKDLSEFLSEIGKYGFL